MSQAGFFYRGFPHPNYTQVPDDVFDVLLAELSESELKVLLYIIRRTFGFKKDSDTISLKQMVDGIKTREGRQLDRGAGVSKTSATRGIAGLVDKGIIVAVRNRSNEKGDEPTSYSLRFSDPVSTFGTPPPLNLVPPRAPNLDPQETEEQETEEQETDLSNYSKDLDGVLSKEDLEQVSWVMRDLAREFADQAPLQSSTTRVTRLFAASGLRLDDFLDTLQAARLRTKQYSGSIKTTPIKSGSGFPAKPKTAYFFSVLEDMVAESKGERIG